MERGAHNQLEIGITSFAIDALRAQFPAINKHFEPWQGVWSLVVFLEAPPQDANFRFLRSKLIALNAGQLSRGNYLYPGELPPQLLDTLTSLYKTSVVVVQVDRWSFDDELTTIRSVFKLSDVFAVYSGISKEISQLLASAREQKELTDTQKIAVYTIYRRLYDPFLKDIGILGKYYSLVDDGITLLLKLQNALEL
jgi:DNA-binding transcriptional regulator PaaX